MIVNNHRYWTGYSSY